MTNKDCVALRCAGPRLKQDICSIFFSNYLVFRQEVSQRVNVITVVLSRGCIETPRISERCFQIFESSRSLIGHCSPCPSTDFAYQYDRLLMKATSTSRPRINLDKPNSIRQSTIPACSPSSASARIYPLHILPHQPLPVSAPCTFSLISLCPYLSPAFI